MRTLFPRVHPTICTDIRTLYGSVESETGFGNSSQEGIEETEQSPRNDGLEYHVWYKAFYVHQIRFLMNTLFFCSLINTGAMMLSKEGTALNDHCSLISDCKKMRSAERRRSYSV